MPLLGIYELIIMHDIHALVRNAPARTIWITIDDLSVLFASLSMVRLLCINIE